jgi:CRP-like cAMP-binding protein/RsiW-degrading membrane proteinase PrsW (M82 family)
MNAVILISYAVAILIPLLALYIVYALDFFGTGKESTVFTCMIWGGIGAFGLAYVINGVFFDAFAYETVTRITAPIIEEILKAFVLVYFIQRPHFRYIVDGTIYGFAVGIGFSVTENVFYINSAADAALITAISRVLSTSLMHATASALVGLALGQIRRTRKHERLGWPIFGILTAIVVHVIFNNLVGQLSGQLLLLVAIGFGIGGSVLIGFLINKGLAEEKKRFAETLGISSGVSSAEVSAIRGLGGNAIEDILDELRLFFGEEKADDIRKLLIKQANIGILRNNLSSPASDRLRAAWQKEVEQLRGEIDDMRNKIGLYVMSFLRNIFPEDDVEIQQTVNESLAAFDPEHINTFDMFITASELAQTFTPAQLESVAHRLKRIAIFKSASLVDLENLCRAITERIFAPGELLFDQGDEGDAMYLIEDGHIEIFIRDNNNNEKVLRTCGPGEVFGEMSLLDGNPRSAAARASGQLKVMVLLRQHFLTFIQSRPQMILTVITFLAEKVRDTTHQVEASINHVRAIAQGDYQDRQAGQSDLFQPAATQSLSTTQNNDGAITHSPNLDVAIEAQDDTAAPALIDGAFAMLASALNERHADLEDRVALHSLATGKRRRRDSSGIDLENLLNKKTEPSNPEHSTDN